jgi:hypothetical protein
MKNHVYRPLFVVIGLVVLIFVARTLIVPEDFGVHEMGYRFGWHRKGNEQDWKNFKVKYQGSEYCNNCHPDKTETISGSPHVVIQCENCHGPAVKMKPGEDGKIDYKNPTFTKHGEDIFVNERDRSRELCLRCHSYLPYEQSGRVGIRMINNDEHNPGVECVDCHNPHSPGFE